MQKRSYTFIWGGLLVVLGLVLLAENFDWLGDWNPPVWSLILGAVGLVFLVTYASDRQQWWALIPGLVISGIAVAVFLAEQDIVEGYVVSAIILAGVGLPFLLIFITDRRHWWALIPGITMCGIALAVFLEGVRFISDEAVAGVIVGGMALGFVSIYWVDRKQWWTLFPGGILASIAVPLLLVAVAEYVWPVALILLGLFLLWRNLGGGPRRRPRRARRAPASPPPIRPARPERPRPPTLEEQIEEALAGESGEVEEVKPASLVDVPPAPEMPQAPEVPSPPDVE
jgi:hypothetical protein